MAPAISIKKLVVLTLLGLVLLVGVVALYGWYTTATITISAPSDSSVHVKQGSAEFKNLGSGTVTYKTTKTESVFIESRREGALTQKSVTPKRRTNTQVSINVKSLGTTERVAPGPFIYPFISGNFIYGINSNTRSLEAKPLSGDTPDKPVLPLLPFLKQVAWTDASNFIYVTASKGAGVVSSNQTLSAQGLPYSAITTPNPSVTALAGDGLFLADGLNIKSARKVAEAKPDTDKLLFSDDMYIFFGWVEFEAPDEHGSETGFSLNKPDEVKEHEPGIKGATLMVFDHGGDQKYKLDLALQDQIYRVVSINENTLAILTSGGMYFVDVSGKDLRKTSFSFGDVLDMQMFNGRLLLLGSEGLWEYSDNQKEYYKVAAYPDGQEYVPNSLAVLGGSLYFSSKASRETLRSNPSALSSSLFKVILGN